MKPAWAPQNISFRAPGLGRQQPGHAPPGMVTAAVNGSMSSRTNGLIALSFQKRMLALSKGERVTKQIGAERANEWVRIRLQQLTVEANRTEPNLLANTRSFFEKHEEVRLRPGSRIDLSTKIIVDSNPRIA